LARQVFLDCFIVVLSFNIQLFLLLWVIKGNRVFTGTEGIFSRLAVTEVVSLPFKVGGIILVKITRVFTVANRCNF
jgi:hypothetical protein